MNTQKIDWKIVCTGLVCITALEIFAITQGFNGTILKMVLIAIAIAIGVTIPAPNIRHV